MDLVKQNVLMVDDRFLPALIDCAEETRKSLTQLRDLVATATVVFPNIPPANIQDERALELLQSFRTVCHGALTRVRSLPDSQSQTEKL